MEGEGWRVSEGVYGRTTLENWDMGTQTDKQCLRYA